MMTDTKGGHEDLPSKLPVFPDMMISQGRVQQEKAHGSRLCLNVAKNENDSFFCKQMIAIFYLVAGMGLSS
jgi:hypothetical protein